MSDITLGNHFIASSLKVDDFTRFQFFFLCIVFL